MRSKDRLDELRRLADSAAGGGVYHATVELALEPAPHAKEIQDIFTEVERMRGWIHEINDNTQLIRRLQADPTFHANKQLQDQLDSAAARAHGAGLKAGGALTQFEARLGAGGAAGGAAGGTVAGRIARLQYAATRRLYGDALAEHRAALDALRDTHLALLHDQIRLTNLTVSEEECEALLDTNNISLFVDNVRAETAQARLALREVEARRDELARVEASLRDVRDLFLQLAHLVAAQQEQVDSVEYYALQASEHVGSGGHHLLKGTVIRSKTRKKKWSLALCVVLGLAVVLLVLVLT